jgi:hypothetical protein
MVGPKTIHCKSKIGNCLSTFLSKIKTLLAEDTEDEMVCMHIMCGGGQRFI